MAILGLVPARGGSKGIVNKNIKMLGGIPLIAHTLKAAGKSNRLDHVFVSTDSKAIAEVAEEFGYTPPFRRPAELAQDDTPDRPVMMHLIDWWHRHHSEPIESIVYLRPTAPFKTGEMIDSVIDQLNADPALTAVRTVSPVAGPEHPYWAYAAENGRLRPFVEGIDETSFLGRQRLPECWRPNGVVDVLRPDSILADGRIYGSDIGYLPLTDWRAADIDTPLDFEWCEFLLDRHVEKAGVAGEDRD